ncbi:scarecrow-like protein 14 [Trifolium pratense]|uniref:scarecrow-like protein 14 n=1 Tax=Trifolium pratense TaxID=57577 RepID=UPI001E6916AF|nr:scarecrow-like protein 14 [Trifolium pratense]
MDPNFLGFETTFEIDDYGNIQLLSDQNPTTNDPYFYPPPYMDPPPPSYNSNSLFNSEEEPLVSTDPSFEDTDFSETVKYISQILMEEDFQQKPCMCYDPITLQHTEKIFFDALESKSPLLSPNQHPLDFLQIPNGNSSATDSGNSSCSNELLKPLSPDTPVSGSTDSGFSSISSVKFDQFIVPKHGLNKNNNDNSISDGVLDLDSSETKVLAQNIFSDVDSMLQFRKGLEEASKFLPQKPQLFTGLENISNSLVSQESKGRVEVIKMEGSDRENSNSSYSINSSSRGLLKSRKNHERQSSEDEEGRSNKQSAVCVEESEITEMFDRVLLSVENVPLCAENKDGSVVDSSGKVGEPDGRGKARSKKPGKKRETVDLRTLLVLCAQAVSASDNRTANELLKQIRQHSSHLGDAPQRLAHYFANALEARMVGAGAGTQILYMSQKMFSAADFLKAYQVFISVCPFKKIAHFFANKMILKTAEKAKTLHIIDFGILYGFQWPILIKFLSKRVGGPPKLRITGIEYPQAGFRPAERIEETGRRLANYCQRFNVSFEYKAIPSRHWETIQIEDLNIKSDEVVAVNCLIRFKNLHDETIEVNSPKDAVLKLIRKINPSIFVQSIVNGTHNAPFFSTRFKESLFHYSATYDMYDTLICRENEWRLTLEREFLGREIMNVVACEGLERVERPETYKQWKVRNLRAGFRQLPLDKDIMDNFRGKLRAWYHKDFVFDEDNNWMLQGWKGRILYASACWVPA